MVLTLELPIHRPRLNWAENYENRFGALPDWLDDLASGEAAALLRLALRRGSPLVHADSAP